VPSPRQCQIQRELHMVNVVADIVARKVELLETMIREFTNTAANLAREIAIEEERTKIKDSAHVAYSTLAKALATRRGNLLMSAADAETRLLVARRELDEARARASGLAGAPEDVEQPNGQASHAA
jgi:flagellar protein FliJ